MAVELTSNTRVALTCNTTDLAYGPTFHSEQAAQTFLEWWPKYHDQAGYPSWMEDTRRITPEEWGPIFGAFQNDHTDAEGEWTV